MLLENYRLEIFNNECKPDAISVQCCAHLEQDVSRALPYLNAELDGFGYIREPPSVTFKIHGKLIIVQGLKIAVNALRDEEEARKIVEWLKQEINTAWENRDRILPWYKDAPRPQVIVILGLLPKTNCGECGDPTCRVFATSVAEGAKDSSRCPVLSNSGKMAIDAYISGFTVKPGDTPW